MQLFYPQPPSKKPPGFKFLLGITMVSKLVQNSQISYSFTFNNYSVIQYVPKFTFSDTFLSYEYIHSHSQHIFIYIPGHDFYSTLAFFIQHFRWCAKFTNYIHIELNEHWTRTVSTYESHLFTFFVLECECLSTWRTREVEAFSCG